MCTRRIFGLAVVALLTLGGRARAYTNQWAAHIDGGEEMARRVAEDYGFRYLGKLENRSKAKRSLPSTSARTLAVYLVVPVLRCAQGSDAVLDDVIDLSVSYAP